jgi:16S rRNA (guanine527-N7)-methyltransferase
LSNLLNNIQLHDVSRETLVLIDDMMMSNEATLSTYVDRLLWWNRKVNLMSRDLTREDVMLHVKHSLFLLPSIRQSPTRLWLDTGTGGGLPGIPLAILCKDVHFILNDVVEKKGVVLKDIVANLGIDNASVQIKDVGKVEMAEPFGVISKHAFKIADLLGRLEGKPWKELLMLKGSDYSNELLGVYDVPVTVEATSIAAAHPHTFFNGKYLIRICPTP